MEQKYRLLNCAKMDTDYLHTNSTTHSFLFGALAEFVDNSRDANAKNLNIYSEKSDECTGDYILNILDDGDGMSPKEAENVIVMGRSEKNLSGNAEMIGHYGNGLKAGSMRLAKDLIIFTIRDNVSTITLISRSFLKEKNIKDILVPIPSFNSKTFEPWFDPNSQTSREQHDDLMRKHKLEMEILLKYSPYHTRDELFKQFKKIGSHGTLLILYNMVLMSNGEPELDVLSDPRDILTGDQYYFNDNTKPLETKSFREYLTILYSDPHMKIYLQQSKVRTRIFDHTLYYVRQYKYESKSAFRKKTENDCENAEKNKTVASNLLREAQSCLASLQKSGANDKLQREELKRRQMNVSKLQEEFDSKKRLAENIKKNLNASKVITFKFGVNINKRSQDGFFIFNSHRLILMYQKSNKHNNEEYNGIVGIADVPYSILEPTHNKQSFADEKETTKLTRAMMDYLEQYIEDLKRETKIADDNMSAFWVQFGYHNPRDKVPDPDDKMGKKRRNSRIKRLIQCDKCLKWRQIPTSRLDGDIEPEYADTWQCSDLNIDTNCAKSEEFNEIGTGELRKTPPKLIAEAPKQPPNRLEPFRPAPSTKRYHEESAIERPPNSILKNVAPVPSLNSRGDVQTARKKTIPRDFDHSYSVDDCQAQSNGNLSEESEACSKADATPKPKFANVVNRARKRPGPRTVGLSDSSDNDSEDPTAQVAKKPKELSRNEQKAKIDSLIDKNKAKRSDGKPVPASEMLNKMAIELKFYLSTFTGLPKFMDLSVSELFELDRENVCRAFVKNIKDS